MKKFKEKVKKAFYAVGAGTTAAALALPVMANASDSGSSSATGIQISFDPSQMFTYSNVIISCLMPVVYITAGLSLGFTVIYALKSAFSSRM